VDLDVPTGSPSHPYAGVLPSPAKADDKPGWAPGAGLNLSLWSDMKETIEA